MTMPFGPKGSGDIRRTNPLPRGMSGFPAVGKGLGGRPARRELFPEPTAIAFYSNGDYALDVFDAKFNRITDIYANTQPTVSASASYEQMWKPPRQNKWMGMGSYGQGSNTKGAVIDISVTPWLVYENYTTISNDGSGSSYIRNMAPGPSGFVAGIDSSTAGDESVNNITTKAEVTGQPASFTSGSGDGTMKVYGNNLYVSRANGTRKYTFSAVNGVLILTESNATINSAGSIAVSSDDAKVYVTSANILYVLNSSLVEITTIDLSVYGLTAPEAIEVSPDDKWLLICGTANPSGRVLIMNTTDYSVRVMNVPLGVGSGRMLGCAWYADSNRYIVSGYSGARTHVGKRTAGGTIKNLYADIFGNSGATFGVAIINY